MSTPTKHYGKWRIRWIDEFGRRQCAVVDDHKAALLQLRQKELEADERRRGLRDPAPTERTFADIAEYWDRERVPLKRSGNDDKNILKQLRGPFAKMRERRFREIHLGPFIRWLQAERVFELVSGDGLPSDVTEARIEGHLAATVSTKSRTEAQASAAAASFCSP